MRENSPLGTGPIATSLSTEIVLKWYLPRYADFDADTIAEDALSAAQDKAAEDSVQRMAQTGETLLLDGEQRASSFATCPTIDTLGCTGLIPNLAADGQYFAIFEDGHHRQLPRLTSGPFQYKAYAFENFKKSAPYAEGTGHAMKTAVIAPSTLKEQFVNDLVDECEKDVRGCFEAGAKRVSIDFTEGRLASQNDLRNPWTGAELLNTFVDLNNQVNIGIHNCPGGDCDLVHSGEVPYSALLPSLFAMNAGYFLIQLASEKDKASVYKQVGDIIRLTRTA
ncbi:MAG: hypothetical protein Q9171_003756 [Xanthocarpia ochracea]